MSIESQMKAVIRDRKNNFYGMFDEYMADDEYYFTHPNDPSFDFIEKYDTDGNPVFSDPAMAEIYSARRARLKTINVVIDSNSKIYYTDDKSSAFFGFSYDEIIGMANNGVTIPDEILDWAYSMADTNAVEMTTDTEGSSAHDLYTSLKNNPLLNIKTITKIFVNKCNEQTQELEAYLDELDPIEREMEAARVDAEAEREKSLNNIKSLVKEWKDLQAKFESGEKLNGSEQQRFEELKGLFGEEDEKYQDSIDSTTKNFTKISAKLSTVTGKAETAFDFGSETLLIAQELAEFEKTEKNRSIFGGLIGAGIAGVLGAVGLAGSKKFSETAHTVGLNTQYFADDVNTTIKEVQLLMQDTADTANFDLEDPSYTVEPLTNDEGIAEPSIKINSKASIDGVSDEPASPEVDATTVEAPQEETDAEPAETDPSNTDGTGVSEASDEAATDATDEEQTDEEMMAEGDSTLEDVNAKSLSLPKLKRLIKEEGVDSEKKGKDALKLVEQLKTQSAVVDEKEEQVQEDTTEVKETSEAEPEEGTDGTENESAMEEAQAGAEESQNDLTAATEAEALTVEGLRETFKASTKANKKYSKDVDEADKKMKESIYTGAFTIAGGGYMTGVGIYNVVTGNALLASAGWWNPFVIAIATYMINTGAMEIGLGATMIAGGTALTVSATEGLEINKEADEKIGLSGEDITTAGESLDEIERQQAEEIESEGGETENTDETDDTEEPDEDESLNKDKSLLGKMYTGNDELPPQRSLVMADGKKSSAIGKENVSKLTGLERQIPSLIEATIEMEQAKQEQAAQSADPESAGVANDVQDPAEVYEEYRQDYKTDLETNKGFQQDIKETNANATTNLGYAALGTTAGAARTALGASEIAIGTVLAAQWWNPVAMMLGLALIKKGTEDTALGTEMLAVGLALTVNSTTTLAAGAIASNQVSESNEKTNDSLATVDAIEAEINSAVQEQLAANGEQDLSGMSTIELLTLIINNGIQSSVLGTDNTEILEQLKAQLPQLLESAPAKADETEEEETTTDKTENKEETEQGSGEKETVFTKYKNDFKADLETNERYSTEIKQARSMSPILKTSFFLGAPVEKASNKIETSNEQTSTALEETEKMEEQVKKAQEEKAKAEEVKENENPEVKTNSKKEGKEEEELTPENAADQEADASESAEDSEDQVKKDEKTIKKQAKQEKKQAKVVKKETKKVNKSEKEAQKADKEGQDYDKLGLDQQKQGEETAANSNQDEVQAQADQTTEEMSEAETISSEVEGLVAEVETNVAETQSAVAAATAENQSIVAEMNAINMELQQDQTQLTNFENQLKQEANKSKASSPAQEQPKQEKEEPQPVAQPKKAAKAAAPKKQAKVEEEKPEEPKNKKEEQKPAPAQKNAEQKPQEVEAPEGSDKIEFASDKEKQPNFVGFVAQSDSLASGSVLVGSKAKTTTTNNQGNNNGNSTQGKGNVLALKNKQKQQAKAAKQQEKAQMAKDNAQQEQPEIKAAKRTTQKPFDISQMQGGNGDGKAQQIRTSMEAVRTAAFNKQARLNDMQIRANNNVMENIQKEAFAQAEAARKERLAREKQERIAKIKEYAGYVQMAGGLTTTAGMIVTKVGTVQEATGTAQLTAGTTQVTEGTALVEAGTTFIATGTAQTVTGTAEVTTGTAMTATGATMAATGATVGATGAAMTTAGTVMISTGTAMLSNPFTAAAGAALVASGTSLTTSGASMTASGATLTASGGTETAAGAAQTAAGVTLVTTGQTTTLTGAQAISLGTTQIATGATQMAAGLTQMASGLSLQATGATIQTVGAIVTAAGAATSAGADIANGNILGGIASIVGAAASVVGVTAPVSQLGNAAIQLGSQGATLAGQLATSNAGQDNSGNNQDQKKKKKFKENQRTQGIIAKTQNKKQAVGNRFNK